MPFLPLLLALALAAGPGASLEAAPPVGPAAAPVDLHPALPPALPPAAAPAPPRAMLLGAPVNGVVAGGAAALISDLVFGGMLAAGMEGAILGDGGNGGMAALGSLGFVFGTPLATTLAARSASPEGSVGYGYLAAFGSRLAAGLAAGGIYSAFLDSAPRGAKNVMVPLLYGVTELVVQPWAASATLEATSPAPGPGALPSPADLARPVTDPATPR